jgi:uncharacterized membrane protein YfhO
VRVNTHYFPGWVASIDSQSVAINHNNSFDYMDLEVPSGIHKISLEFRNTPIREIGNLISILSIITLSLLLLWSMAGLFKRSEGPTNDSSLDC